MLVAPDIHAIFAEQAEYTGPHPPNVYLVVSRGEAVIVDSGFGDDAAVQIRLDYLAKYPQLNISHIVLTHTHLDHAGGAAALREKTGAKIAMHRLEVGGIEDAQKREKAPPKKKLSAKEKERRALEEPVAKATPDVLLEDGDAITFGVRQLEVVHTPGHKVGHICPFLRDEKLMFTGDHIVGEGTVAVSPPPYGSMTEYIASLRKLQSLDIGLLLPGHGPTIDAPQQKVAELIDHRLMRERQVLELVQKGVETPGALRKAIYPALDRRLYPFAKGQMLSHLAKLREEGLVRTAKRGGVVHARPAES
jgi:glyoxylase-like metal-dependent hydrolase (beta-lactamase superfamily II)